MPSPLSILIVEDNLADFERIAKELARFGFDARCQRVATEGAFAACLEPRPDVILAVDSLAGFGSLRALEILRESSLQIPFIVLTASSKEDQVVEYLKKGAADYLSKSSILRVGPAVERALEESDLRRQNLAAEQALRRKNLELEEQYRRAQSASRMKSIFLANMSHELRTPLTAVIGFAELLVDGKVGALSAQQQDFTQDILANGKHLLTLINDVLDLARVESGNMPFHPERICLPDLIRETIAGPKLFASARNISLTTDVQMSAIEIFLDPQKLRQVLLNYVSNALKFTPPGGVSRCTPISPRIPLFVWKWRTPASASRRRTSSGFFRIFINSTEACRRMCKGPAWGWLSPSGWSKRKAVKWVCSATPAKAAVSGPNCRLRRTGSKRSGRGSSKLLGPARRRRLSKPRLSRCPRIKDPRGSYWTSRRRRGL